MKTNKDSVILVDKNDNIIGYEEKVKAHLGQGKRHRAFSVFIFDKDKRLLLQKRAQNKMLWPGFWANTCCSHPRKGEDYLDAAKRRLKEEVGIDAKLRSVFKFYYQAKYKNIGSENELCTVLAGKYNGHKINPDQEEVAEWQWINIKELKKDMQRHPNIYAPWFRIEMKKIKKILDTSD